MNSSLRRIALGGFLSFSSISPALTAPVDDVSRAVHTAGAADVAQAQPKQFLTAFTAVIARTKLHQLPDYVAVAIRLRPDLSSQITVTALQAAVRKAHTEQTLYAVLERIMRAAILANPDAAASIARAAVEALPQLRDRFIAIAIASAPQHRLVILEATGASGPLAGLFRRAGSDGAVFPATFGTMSPGNMPEGEVNSPEQPPAIP